MSKTKSNKAKISADDQQSDSAIFGTVFFYCILIIFLPVATFFISKFFIFDLVFDLTSVSSNIYAAISSVIALHLALALYLYRAYFDDKPKQKPAFQKQD
ncbi:unnamed protein product [Diamesa serratosioi]